MDLQEFLDFRDNSNDNYYKMIETRHITIKTNIIL